MTNKTQNNLSVTNLSSVLDHIKNLATTLGSLTAIFYILGFIVINTFLLSYGINDMNFLNTKYISVGILFVILISLAVIPTIAIDIGGESHKNSQVKISGWGLGWTLISLFISWICETWLITWLSAFSGSVTLINDQENMRLFWKLFPGWFIPLLLFGVLTRIITFFANLYISSRDDPIHTIRKGYPGFLLPFMGSVWILCLLFAIYSYSTIIYPKISPSLGGGKNTTIQIITYKESLSTLQTLIPFQDSGRSIPVKLLEQSANNYILIIQDKISGIENTILIDKDLIQGYISIENP